MYKRGISEVVAVVFILLIVIAAISIIWLAILPLIEDSSSFESDADLSILTSEGYTVIDRDAGLIDVQVERGNDESELGGVQFIFSSGPETNTTIRDAPDANQKKVYHFNISDLGLDDVISVKIAPVFDGKPGMVTAELTNIPEGSLGGEELVMVTYWYDGDGDGYGNGTSKEFPQGEQPDNWYANLDGTDDCDDSDEDVYPGAEEICDGRDNQCPNDDGYGLNELEEYDAIYTCDYEFCIQGGGDLCNWNFDDCNFSAMKYGCDNYCNLLEGNCVDCLVDEHCDDGNESTNDYCSAGSCVNSMPVLGIDLLDG
ncbi:MAG: MopE-related protein, partial [Candidatus Nanoarchaeia archaeon]